MASSTSGAGHGIDPLPNPNSSLNTTPVEMDELDTPKKTIDGAGSSALLNNNTSIPETSPIASDNPSTSSALPTTTTTTTTTTITTTDMIDPLNQNARPQDGNSPSQEQSTAPNTTHNEPTSSTAPAPAPPAPPTSNIEDQAPPPLHHPPLKNHAPRAPALTPTHGTPHLPTDAGPTLLITLLLSTGARHPYKIDEKYLTKRAVTVPGVTEGGKKDPLTISVYTLKELILREWREEWEARPNNPSSIRLIFFGRLLDDKNALKECKFNLDTSNVVHMTIKPSDIIPEDEGAMKNAERRREESEGTAGCRCVIL